MVILLFLLLLLLLLLLILILLLLFIRLLISRFMDLWKIINSSLCLINELSVSIFLIFSFLL